jgi:carboxyl-terminal processing protease
MLNMEEYVKFLNKTDKNVLKALEVLEAGESFPSAPEQSTQPANERTEETIAKADQGRKKASISPCADGKILHTA